ncbi:Ubiquitin-activating enzyme active site [Parelaphostrongylus tenuis]|uniref:SUMO-activating enzyme subunit n=1 Tax=Parelaphostrongylus tenuis TaxID=148309 RepID=A0AAD5MV58_PARTN|nr:Ubiquitin-activating enzyme active site [Parelaphostrongylus tenuis]
MRIAEELALIGYGDIHVIDMDTIDVSNLNRQFLFRREHVGRSKAEVAAEAIRQLCPSIKITFDLDTIFSAKFNLPFFQQFDIVMNALDNRAARNHVNRMCIAAKVPLIESGSAGYLGQVKPIVRDLTECYECSPVSDRQKTFPGCTIRNTPSEHIHCTVWSKHAFNQLFGELDIDDDISPDLTDKGDDGVAGDVNDTGAHPMEEGQEGDKSDGVAPSADESIPPEPSELEGKKIFDKLFYSDINYLLLMKHLWRERRAPVPMRKADIVAASASSSASSSAPLEDMNKVWSLAECAEVFCESVAALSRRKNAENTVLHWDKDDDEAMRFVASCANIRAVIFGIPCKSLFEIKSMAGNIVPAIATTNAIVAGLVAIEAAKIISGDLDKLRVTVITAPNHRGNVLIDHVPFTPNPACFVCSDKRECFVRLNPDQVTVKALQDKFLKGALNMVEPDVIESRTSRIIISSEEGETSDIESKTLSELSIGNGALLLCDDFRQKLELKLILSASTTMKADEFMVLNDSGESKENNEGNTRKRKGEATAHDLQEEEIESKRVKL